jgi:hypothetical protein
MILRLPERTFRMATKKKAASRVSGYRVGPPPATLDQVVEAIDVLDREQDKRHEDLMDSLKDIKDLLKEIASNLSERE